MVDYISLIQANPRISVIVFAVVIVFFISLVNYFVLDKDRLREIKGRQKEMNKQIKEHQKAGEHEKAMSLQKELMSEMPEMFKHSLKPMLITTIPVLVLFGIFRGIFDETAIAGSWYWWYFAAALVSSLIFRKILKLP